MKQLSINLLKILPKIIKLHDSTVNMVRHLEIAIPFFFFSPKRES